MIQLPMLEWIVGGEVFVNWQNDQWQLGSRHRLHWHIILLRSLPVHI